MKRPALATIALLLLLTGLAFGQPDDAEVEPGDAMIDAPAEPGILADEPADETPPTTNGRSTNGRRPPETVPAPEAEYESYPVHDEPLWPDYYGPPPYNCGGFRCGPDQCGQLACPKPLLPGTWGQFDVLVWGTKGETIPALVTTSPQGTPANIAGVLPSSTTTILYGEQVVNTDPRAGGRVNAGLWLDDCQDFGLGGSFLAIGRSTDAYRQRSTPGGDPIIARPFFDPSINEPNTLLVAYPGQSQGAVAARETSDFLAADAYLRDAISRGCNYRLDFIYGYRFARLDDSVTVLDEIIATGGNQNIPVGTTLRGRDSFLTRNFFNGGQIGLWYQRQWDCWGWEALGRIAFGNVYQVQQIEGRTRVDVPGVGSSETEGSLLALPSNIGTHHRNQFAVMPEVQMMLTYQFRPNWKARIGYTFLYISQVARAQRQIDTTVNSSQVGNNPLVGPGRPAVLWRTTDFWAQGMNFGFEYSY